MDRTTRFGRFLGRVKAGIIADVPPSIDACEACRESDCSEERWQTCPTRLAVETERLSELRAAQESAGAPGEAARAPGGDRRGKKKRAELPRKKRLAPT